MKVSFDFDGTLSRKDVQEYAKSLLERGIEVWITTSRSHESNAEAMEWNDDLYLVARELGIPKSQIHFMNAWIYGDDKSYWLKDQDFIWHLDDDWLELKSIQRECKQTFGISVFGTNTWKQKCDKLLK